MLNDFENYKDDDIENYKDAKVLISRALCVEKAKSSSSKHDPETPTQQKDALRDKTMARNSYNKKGHEMIKASLGEHMCYHLLNY